MKKLFTLLLILSFSNTFAQDVVVDSTETRWQLFKYDAGNIFKGIGHSYIQPFKWKGKQWAQFGGLVAGTGVIYLTDDETSRFIKANKESVPTFIRKYGEFYGNPENNYLLTSGVYLVGLFTKNEKLRRTGVLLIASATSSGLLQQVLKSLVGRARPLAGLGKDTFDPFEDSRIYHSFPSGHALMAFTNAYAIGKQFKNPWVKAGIYTVGAIPGISRLWDGQHWLSDVVFSWVLSIATVECIDRYLDRKYDQKYNSQSKKVSWNLNFGPGTMGVSMNF